jgi:serine/threonine protein kinase
MSKPHIGRYQYIQDLGRGATSTVYKAHDPLLDRDVAIKVIHPKLSTQPGFVQRFEREARALAKLRHPNIVHIYDMGYEEEVCYLVIELVDGETLKTRLYSLREKNKIMPIGETRRVISEICDAVDYAHRSRLAHRDLKPSNVMFDENDRPILMDFGIVKMFDLPTITVAGGVLGTPLYMSPEQCQGLFFGEQSDIYSLGVIFYEMLTGMLPFSYSSVSRILKAHINEPPAPPSEINPKLSSQIDKIILKALAKKPRERHKTASEFSIEFLNVFNDIKTQEVISGEKGLEPKIVEFAYLRSLSSGNRYKLDRLIENKVGRTIPGKVVEIDLSGEHGSEYIHSIHITITYSESGWQIRPLKSNKNPTIVNERLITPGTLLVLSNNDRIALSSTQLVFEIISEKPKT